MSNNKSMKLRSDTRFNDICDNLNVLIRKSNNAVDLHLDNYETIIAIFKIVNEHIVGLMNQFYNNKKDQRFALTIILKCDQLCEIITRMNSMDELKELLIISKKKVVVHFKKIMKQKKTYLSPNTLNQIALLKL
jgi:hypothetical protein